MIESVLLFAIVVAVIAAVSIVIGMLVAPLLGRMTEPNDEDAGDGVD